MTFQELLEQFGFDVQELLKTEVGSNKLGQTFHVKANIGSDHLDGVPELELVVTALDWRPKKDDGHRNPNCPVCKKRICKKEGG